MKYSRTIDATEMRDINRSAILDFVRRKGPTSRSAIAEELQVSPPTVMRILDELIVENLVRHTGEKEWSGGRRRSLIELNVEGHLTIGVDLGSSNFYGAVADLGGNVLFEQTVTQDGTQGDESYRLLITLIQQLLAYANGTGHLIQGIGVGVPGITRHESGVVQWAPSLNWRDFPLRDWLKKEFDLPVIVDNDVNLSALGEMWFGEGQNVDSLVLLNIGAGIGAGIVIDGALYRGVNQAAGEIGYLLPGHDFLSQDYPGFGALETLVAETRIMEKARHSLQGQWPDKKLAVLSIGDIFDAHCREEAWAVEIIQPVIDYLAIAIAAISAFFDPAIIILGGGVARSAVQLIAPIRERITGKVPFLPPIVASRLGQRAAVLGAVINLLHNTSDYYIVRKLS